MGRVTIHFPTASWQQTYPFRGSRVLKVASFLTQPAFHSKCFEASNSLTFKHQCRITHRAAGKTFVCSSTSSDRFCGNIHSGKEPLRLASRERNDNLFAWTRHYGTPSDNHVPSLRMSGLELESLSPTSPSLELRLPSSCTMQDYNGDALIMQSLPRASLLIIRMDISSIVHSPSR